MRRIMIVDDEKDFLTMTKLNLERTGKYEVMAIPDASGILEAVRAFKPEVILLDIIMLKIDGIEVCELLNSDPDGRKIPLIILSALGADKDKRMMYKLGVIDYLVKPVETAEL
ncbi:MAG: response regulator, partial [Candidatus Omnitrophica bacterium]|nr:response regulator [Candidatus Omnitrophota bacterium]